MTVHGGRRWWIVGVGLGLVVFAFGGLLVKAGLEDADRWASVLGLFLNIAGLAVTVTSAVQGRRRSSPATGKVTNTIRNSEVAGPAVIGRDLTRVSLTGTPIPDSAPAAGGVPSGDVENMVDGGRFHGPLIMARDVDGVVLPPSGSNQPVGNGSGQ